MTKIAIFAMLVALFPLVAREPVLNLKFDEGQGHLALDPMGPGVARLNGATWAPGISGTALAFSGKASATVSTNGVALNPRSLSLRFWFFAEGEGNDRQLVVKTGSGKDGFRLAMTGRRLAWQMPSGEKPWGFSLVAPVELPPRVWHSVVAEYDGEALFLFVDGTGGVQLPRPGGMAPSSVPLTLGAFDASGTAGFVGRLDEFQISETLLGAEGAGQYHRQLWAIYERAQKDRREKTLGLPALGVTGVTTSAAPGALSPLMTGAQFDFFSVPIRQRLQNEDMLGTWSRVPIRVLRYPGGTWGDHYIWDNPAKSYFATGDSNVVSPQAFLDLCHKIGAEPILQVNMGSTGGDNNNRVNPTQIADLEKGAAWAAAWVRDINLRQKRKVTFWEIGNEVWIWLSPEEYARALAIYSKAMKAVDPTIKIIACGLSSKVGPFSAPWLSFPNDPTWKPRVGVMNEPVSWNRALFSLAKGAFDFLAPHPYISASSNGPARVMYLETLSKISHLDGMKTQYEAVGPAGGPVQIAITEWACNFPYSVAGSSGKIPPEKGFFYTLGNGIAMGYYFGRLLEDSRNQMAVLHSLGDVQTLWHWGRKEMAKGEPLEHPAMMAFRLWGNYLGPKRVSVGVTGLPDLDVAGEKIPGVFLFASESETNRYLVAINLDPDRSAKLRWQVPGPADVTVLSGPSLETHNFDDFNQGQKTVALEDSTLAPTDGALLFSIPKHGMVGLRVKK